MKCVPIILIPSLAALVGCGGSGEPASSLSALPVVDQQRVVFPAGAPQVKGIATALAEPAGPRSLILGGHLAWDEDRTVRVYTPVTGRIIAVNATLGQKVRAGDELLAIDSPDFGQAQADLAKASADLTQAERNMARVRVLLEHGAAATKDLEAAEADRARALAERDRCARRLSLWNDRGTGVDQHFHLIAPAAGVVVERTAAVGSEARSDAVMANASLASNPLMVITDPLHLSLWIDVPEAEMGAIVTDMPVTVTTRAWPGRTFEARVAAVIQALDPQTRVCRVRATVNDPSGLLRAEQYVEATVQVPSAARAQVPKRAAYLTDGGWRIFVQEADGGFARREVTIGAEVGDHIEIMSGLAPGERTVVAGALLLNEYIPSLLTGGIAADTRVNPGPLAGSDHQAAGHGSTDDSRLPVNGG